MPWSWRQFWPWHKRASSRVPAGTADALRHLYFNYRRQKRLWGYSVLSSVMLMCLFFVLSLFVHPDPWVIVIPLIALAFSVMQLHRCKDIVRVIRQALSIQQQIDREKAAAEAEAPEAAAPGESPPPNGPARREPLPEPKEPPEDGLN